MVGIWGKGRNKSAFQTMGTVSKSVEEDRKSEERELCQWLGMEGKDGKCKVDGEGKPGKDHGILHLYKRTHSFFVCTGETMPVTDAAVL